MSKKEKYDKAIISIQKLIVNHKKQGALYDQLLETMIIRKHFGEDGGLYGIFKRKHFDKNYNGGFQENYRHTKFYAEGYRPKPQKMIEDDEIVIIDTETHRYVREKIKVNYDKKVIRMAEKTKRKNKK